MPILNRRKDPAAMPEDAKYDYGKYCYIIAAYPGTGIRSFNDETIELAEISVIDPPKRRTAGWAGRYVGKAVKARSDHRFVIITATPETIKATQDTGLPYLAAIPTPEALDTCKPRITQDAPGTDPERYGKGYADDIQALRDAVPNRHVLLIRPHMDLQQAMATAQLL